MLFGVEDVLSTPGMSVREDAQSWGTGGPLPSNSTSLIEGKRTESYQSSSNRMDTLYSLELGAKGNATWGSDLLGLPDEVIEFGGASWLAVQDSFVSTDDCRVFVWLDGSDKETDRQVSTVFFCLEAEPIFKYPLAHSAAFMRCRSSGYLKCFFFSYNYFMTSSCFN